MVISIGWYIEKYGSLEEALKRVIMEACVLSHQIHFLSEEVERLGGDPKKVIESVPPIR